LVPIGHSYQNQQTYHDRPWDEYCDEYGLLKLRPGREFREFARKPQRTALPTTMATAMATGEAGPKAGESGFVISVRPTHW
jgi:hypothetical protein